MTPPLENVDWSRFLGRPPLPGPDAGALESLRHSPILITGAGGSIGSALALRIAALAPRTLLLLDTSENNLFQLDCALRESFPSTSTAPILGSVSDRPLLEEVFSTHAPRTVFHAAAFKHVPLLEEHPLAAMTNNILGTHTLAAVAADHNARVVLLSTDKAVSPASVMGATKRVSEQVVLAIGGAVLRLGNVLASRGSVTETFARQIVRGGPVTVTGRASLRYFLTLDEAVGLLCAAAGLPSPALLAPALTVPHAITALAAFLCGELAPGLEIPIVFTGRRPGDKLAESLWAAAETPRISEIPGLLRVDSTLLPPPVRAAGLAALAAAVAVRDLPAALQALCALVPEYTPSPTVAALSRQSHLRVFA